jgi:asparagine synthase (glutamine-hydrolysing)
MSAIAAVFSAEARDQLHATAAMLRAAAHRARGAPRTWHAGAIVLGCRSRAQSDSSSLAHSHSGHAVVFDGRLDNRDDLVAALGTPARASDAALVLAAYERWREDAPGSLLGDFAFALWDAAARRVFCARDVFGQRPLFYACAGQIVAIGSEPQQVLAHPAVPRGIN